MKENFYLQSMASKEMVGWFRGLRLTLVGEAALVPHRSVWFHSIVERWHDRTIRLSQGCVAGSIGHLQSRGK